MCKRETPCSVISVRYQLGVLFLWLLVVEPFALFGYGDHGDAWGVAQCATTLYTTGHYVPSRGMGYPLFEFAVAPLVVLGGAFYSNQASIVAGAAIVLALCRLANLGQLRNPKIIIPAIAFLPVVINSASSTMDLIPAMAFLWWAYVAYCRRSYYLAATLIGLACGCRATSGLLLVPLVIGTSRKRTVAKIFRVCALCVAVAVVAYSPALVTYGTSRITASLMNPWIIPGADPPPSIPAYILVAAYYAVCLLGILPTIVLLGILVWSVIQKDCRIALSTPWPKSQVAFHGSVFLVWGLCYMLMPAKTEYLFPLLISITFLVDRLPAKAFVAACCLAFLSYHVINVDTKGGESGKRRLVRFSPVRIYLAPSPGAALVS